MSSVWNPDNVRDVAESVGIASLADNVVEELARDVDFRLAQVLEEALKFMRHGKRTTLSTQDISNALKVLNVEPLYGYESTRPLRFGEASLGPGQPLYYVEDEEVDFEKLINAPLPKVPREITFTAHWLAVEGVQPSIPQNPNTNTADLLPKGPNANPHLAAANGLDNVNVKPLVKHVLSKESQELFNKLSGALVDETNIEWQNAALAAISTEPGIHQLTTYLLSFIAEKVTHNMKNLFILSQMMRASEALLNNQAIYLDPYIAYMVPPILTCCIGGKLGPANQPAPSNASSETLGGAVPDYSRAASDAFYLRTLAAHLLRNICRKYSSSNQGLKSRIARTCLKQFMDPDKTVGAHFGALQALLLVLGPSDALRGLILPNIKMYSEDFLAKKLADESTRHDAEILLEVLVGSFPALVPKAVRERAEKAKREGTYTASNLEDVREKLVDKVGDLVAGRLISKKMDLEAQELLSKDFDI
ncbi:hypothetical protein COCCADRAFT_86847 [Bipolaris zeicola 26-R-13]|uniref:TBP-associated factor 6 n=1 Tax=Cochliobolus carbonum (strain 26-R-13) TaxID=930089 RepID=W6YN36_COCC2|nr:uncharacterized protein COCCADRAFT_86847 [Bipolaris zeicola 26-R-13]EUC36939.1 hypothetical protein COCCADRAFT_86847 [Bipolaris zeicola 26-R-13]